MEPKDDTAPPAEEPKEEEEVMLEDVSVRSLVIGSADVRSHIETYLTEVPEIIRTSFHSIDSLLQKWTNGYNRQIVEVFLGKKRLGLSVFHQDH